MDPETLALLKEQHAAYCADMAPFWDQGDRENAELAEAMAATPGPRGTTYRLMRESSRKRCKAAQEVCDVCGHSINYTARCGPRSWECDHFVSVSDDPSKSLEPSNFRARTACATDAGRPQRPRESRCNRWWGSQASSGERPAGPVIPGPLCTLSARRPATGSKTCPELHRTWCAILGLNQ